MPCRAIRMELMMDRASRTAGRINAFVNPLLMCLFLPVIEGASALDLSSPTGFWGQLVVATIVAEVVSALPVFGKTVGMCVDFFGFEEGTPAAKIFGTAFGATLLFCLIGLFEIAFQTGFGTVGGKPYFARWANLVVSGWAFVVVGGVIVDPFVLALARVLAGTSKAGAEGAALEAETVDD